MISVTYASSHTRFSFEGMDEVLAVSRTNNARQGVTGALFYDRTDILQNLEGDPAEVRKTLERIAVDPRHTKLKVLSTKRIDVRRFKDWSMRAALLDNEKLISFRVVPNLGVLDFQPRRWSATETEDFLDKASEALSPAPPNPPLLKRPIAPRASRFTRVIDELLRQEAG